MPALKLSPAAEPTKKPTAENDIYLDEFGRERLYSEAVGSGRFKVLCSSKKTAALIVFAVIGILIALLPLVQILLSSFVNDDKLEDNGATIIVFLSNYPMGFVLVGAVITAVMVIIYMIGDECTYYANGREFVVADKKGAETHIYYTEVQGVHYFRAPLGYKVEILTRYGIISYHCVDKRKNITEKPEKLPFDIIKKRIKK